MEELKNFIGGELVPAVSGATLENWPPATGEVYGGKLHDPSSAGRRRLHLTGELASVCIKT